MENYADCDLKQDPRKWRSSRPLDAKHETSQGLEIRTMQGPVTMLGFVFKYDKLKIRSVCNEIRLIITVRFLGAFRETMAQLCGASDRVPCSVCKAVQTSI
jgi:hypothetical protein